MSGDELPKQAKKVIESLADKLGVGDFAEIIEKNLKDEPGQFREVECGYCKKPYRPKSLLDYDTCTICGADNFEYDFTKW